MPSYLLGPVAGPAGVATYWSAAAGDVDARARQNQAPLSSFEHHQPLDQVTIATSSGMSATSTAAQQRQQVTAALTCVDRQLNCTTPRKSPRHRLMNFSAIDTSFNNRPNNHNH